MTTKTPTRKGRTIAMAAAVALAGSAFASPAFAADFTVVAPDKTDASGWKTDSFTVAKVDGIAWSYKIGAADPVAISDTDLTVKPFATAKTAPASGDVTVLATPTDKTKTVNEKDAGVAESFTVSFSTATTTFVTPKAPTVKRDKKSGLDVVTLPFVKGLDWTVKEGTAAAAKFTFAGTKAEVYPTATNKPTKLTITAGVDVDKGYVLGKDGTVVLSEVVIDPLKSAAKVVDKPGAVADVNDLPGNTKDSVTLEYTEGVIWVVNGKDIKIAPGKTAIVKRVKTQTSVDVSFKAATGYTFETDVTAEDTIKTSFTDLENAAPKVTVTAGTATARPAVSITPTVAATVKTWSFTPSASGAREIKFALPQGMTTVKFNLPGAGTLKAVPAAGYKLTNPKDVTSGTEAADNSITWAVTAG